MFKRTRIVALVLGVASLAQGEPSSERIARYMDARAKTGFCGVALVMHGDDVLLRSGYGFADAELAVENTPDMVFRIGSVSKPFVATAALRLVAKEQLRLDDPIAKYVPGIPTAWRGVQVEHLLSHTSGIPDLFGEAAAGPSTELRSVVDKVLQKLADAELQSEPGSIYRYNNFGYLLLAYVLEAADQHPWIEILNREVFVPAGLQSTRYDDPWSIVPGRVRGYTKKQGGILNTEYKDHGGFSAGGLLSTVDDLRRFVSTLESGSLLPDELHHRMLTPVQGNYGLGWQVARFYERDVLDHTGGIGGFAAHIAYYPAEKLFVGVLSNVEDEPAKATACDLAAAVFGEDTLLDKSPLVTARASWLEDVVGSYMGEDGETRVVTRDGDRMTLQLGSTVFELTPIGAMTFAIADRPGMVAYFSGDAGKKAETMTAGSCGSTIFVLRRVGD